MAKKNFAEDPPDELAPETMRDETQSGEPGGNLPVHRQTTALVDPDAAANFNAAGMRPPWLTLVHGVGEAADTFNPGDLILAKENLVCPKGKTMDVIILNVDQYVKQRVSNDDWNAGVRPKTFKTMAEAAAAGLQTQWVGGIGPDVSPAMDLTLLLRRPPEVNCGLFAIELGDGFEYAICKFSVDKTAYTVLFNDIALIIKAKLKTTGVFSAVWTANTELSKPNTKGNRSQVTRFRFKEMLKPEVVQSIFGVLGTPSNG